MSRHNAQQVLACGCELGEGPQWHAAAGRLYWCDILEGRLHWLVPASGETGHADFGHCISLAVPLAHGGVLVVGESALERFDPASGQREHLLDFEADDPVTRSNDGRVDRHGSLWLSSMGKAAEQGAGSLYRLHRGELVKLRGNLTIPNAICFSAGGEYAHFADTALGVVYRWALDGEGWPQGEPVAWADFSTRSGNPDGAVIDREGAMWLALWGAGKVLRLDGEANITDEIVLPTAQPSCPAFGGEHLDRLYVTTAREGMDADQRAREPTAGDLFIAELDVPGLAEPPLRLK
ncbi:Sugar lactone lactonase YvrE [Modicisalibacter ilicicola DSM 19980]|uniref:Sugar lactone lactonase YvrE n=1 Tax=Modicisalibacter ilicicola DSM 19980 TaxID=1121942 RepID=A0A1M4U7G1_9GAMM|nr:SMP-30/gluconolactonase/LRE family protein [Halomonas ilicicola]SHE52811.1 Sugar lactone lactonase YvrE [Halomonas ilicicola DSM 19980]